MKNNTFTGFDRRWFISRSFSSCVFCCFAGPIAFAADRNNPISYGQKHKFQTDAEMTMQQVYNFAFKQWYIPAMKNLMKQIGKEKFLDMLKTSSEMLYSTEQNADVNYNERTLTAFANNLKKAAEGYYKLRGSYEFIYS
jgi:hypothetical protein